jgi:hypothetical protein
MPLPSSQTPSRPAPRPKNRLTAVSTTNADKDLLIDEYVELYDKGEAFKADVIAAKERTILRATKAFDSVLVCSFRFSVARANSIRRIRSLI